MPSIVGGWGGGGACGQKMECPIIPKVQTEVPLLGEASL